MKKTVSSIPFFLLMLSVPWMACDDNVPPENLVVYSPAFSQDDVIPDRHTCFGEGASPALFIEFCPAGTAQFALVVEDPSLSDADKTLWIVWGIPENTGYLPDGVPPDNHESGHLRQGSAFNLQVGYQPPCPPSGETHRYRFKAFALDSTELDGLDSVVDRTAFESAIDGHVLGTGTLEGVSTGR